MATCGGSTLTVDAMSDVCADFPMTWPEVWSRCDDDKDKLGLMNRFSRAIIGVAATAALIGGSGLITADPEVVAKRHSCGYHCNPDGSPATEAAPPQAPDVYLVGRTNIHSGGRSGGAANKRHGGGGRNHPNACEIVTCTGVQPLGRTNVHSDGRGGGKALPRLGKPRQRGFGRYGIRKV